MRARTALPLVLMGCLACLAFAGCTRAPAQAPRMGPPVVTVAYPLEQNLADYAEFTGQTAAVKTVEVRARVWGYLESVNFTEGALVKKGQLLFRIDARPYQALVNQAIEFRGVQRGRRAHGQRLRLFLPFVSGCVRFTRHTSPQ